MPEQIPQQALEVLRSPERSTSYKPLVGLQARMLIGGENLNSKNITLPNIDSQRIDQSFATRQNTTYQYLSNASTQERKDWWNTQGINSLDERLKIWVETTTATFQKNKDLLNKKGWKDALAKLSIDSDAFSQQHAFNLYNEYFTGDNKQSQTTAFITKVVDAYAQDYSSLKKDLPAFQWLAGMFGGTGKEVVAQLIDAEIRSHIPQEKDILITEANEPETVDSKQVSRLNRINDKEVQLLDYLYKGKDQNPPIDGKPPTGESEGEDPFRPPEPTKEDPKKYRTRLHRVDSKKDDNSAIVRKFPMNNELQRLTDPTRIAEILKSRDPLKYPGDVASIAGEIGEEEKSFQNWLKRINISPDKYSSIIQRNLNQYSNFLKEHYNLNLPEINELTIVPLHGKVSQAWNPSHGALGFFNPRYPVLFVDFDVMRSMVDRYRVGENQGDVDLDTEEGMIIEKILSEVQPHEYTHALADIANWHLVKNEGTPEEKTTDIEPAKLGLFLVKPVRPKENMVSRWETLIAIERGRYLMEAVTQKLTGQWVVERTGHPPKNPAYWREIQVLDLLTSKIAKERDVPQEKVFQKFVDAYFTPGGFKHLADYLSGKKVTQPEKETGKGGKIEYDENRKHFLQIIYALMEHENQKGGGNYELTKHYIQGDLTANNIAELGSFISGYNRKGNRVQLTPDAVEEIRSTIAKPKNVQTLDQINAKLLDYSMDKAA